MSKIQNPTEDTKLTGTTETAIVSGKTITLGGDLETNGNHLTNNGVKVLSLEPSIGGVNSVGVTSGTTGNAAIIHVSSETDVNPDLELRGQGTGNVRITDGASTARAIEFELDGATLGTTATIESDHTSDITLTLPAASTTLTGTTESATLTNKTISGSTNIITDIDVEASFADVGGASLMSFNASGSFSLMGPGAAGTVLTGTGVTSVPTFQTPTTDSMWSFVSTVTGPLTAADFLGLTGSIYKVIIEGFVPNTDGAFLVGTLSNDGGTSFASTNYQSASNVVRVGSGQTSEIGTTAHFRLTNNGTGAATGEFGLSGEITYTNLNTANPVNAMWKISHMSAAIGTLETINGTGVSAASSNGGSTVQVDSIRLIPTTGTILSGTFHLFELNTG